MVGGRKGHHRACYRHCAASCHVSICSGLSCCSADPPRLTRMRQAARQRFEQKFTADANRDVLRAICAPAIALRSAIAGLQ